MYTNFITNLEACTRETGTIWDSTGELKHQWESFFVI